MTLLPAAAIAELLMEYFDNDFNKSLEWLLTPNPLFGGVTPEHMMATGKEDILIEWMQSQIDESDTLE